MKNYKTALITMAGGAAALFLAGCVVTGTTYVREEPRRYYGPPPGPVIVEGPQPAPVIVEPAPVIVVHRPVPAPLVEVVPPRPGPEYVWIRGYYVARGEGWEWVRGHYERPPHPGAVWVEPRYEPHGTDIHFSVGVWR